MQFLSSAQMRAIETRAIESGQVSGAVLMERAGMGAMRAILDAWPVDAGAVDAGAGGQALVLCGPGNNGGDGYVIARGLAARGWAVRVLALGDPARLPPDARAAHDAWRALGPVTGLDAVAMIDAAHWADVGQPLVVVDALFGIGLSRPLGAELRDAAAAFGAEATARGLDLRLVAVDVPSGLSDAMPDGPALWDDRPATLPRLTVTFHALKDAHRVLAARGANIVTVDIGLPA